ncbi:hypothetical protein HanRHA438_Chr13g0589721 [Helianthus annuus]|nr:hypothetical protein HanIR_Chr13g0630191 [Helianthus annuus]KAJ0857404.1 hypothetical protein HanRHA438_Chr13g0589721 [Helianthus annuus]
MTTPHSLTLVLRLDGMGLVPGSFWSGAGPNTAPPPPGFVLAVLFQTLVPVHKRTKIIPPPLSHIYTYNIYIYFLGPSPHFHTSILFAPSSYPSYVALT